MPRSPSSLNENQESILRWVAEGAPADRFPDGFAHRITARALASRGYVSIAGRGDSWRADITSAGRVWLEQHRAPEQPAPSPEAEELYARVREADGLLALEHDADEDLYRRLVDDYLESPSRERGKKMVLHSSWLIGGITSIEIVGVFEEVVPHGYVLVADEGKVKHPLAKAFLREPHRSFVTGDHMDRAARILEATIGEAERRGWEVQRHTPSDEWRFDTWRAEDAHFDIQTAEARYAVQIREISAQGGKQIPYGARDRGPAWIGGRTTAFVSTGRLELRLFGWFQHHDGTSFREVKRPLKPMGLVIDELLRVVSITDLRLEERRQQAERERDRKRARWEAVRSRAVEQYVDAKRIEALRDQANRWAESQQLRSYVAAGRAQLQPDSPEALRDWFEWAARRADSIDPLAETAALVPAVADPTPEDLRPFMRGLDPRDPYR